MEADSKWLLVTCSSQKVHMSVCFQDEKEEDVCEEEDLVRNKANISVNKKRQLWWESRRGTDEKNVRQHPKCSRWQPLGMSRIGFCGKPYYFVEKVEIEELSVCVGEGMQTLTVIVVTGSSWKQLN